MSYASKRRGKSIGLPQICYDIAYFVLPHYAYKELDKLEELCRETPAAAGPFFYVMACHMEEVEPVKSDAVLLKWHCGRLGAEFEHFTLEYPAPPPVDTSKVESLEHVVLAPHFSTVVRNAKNGQVGYFILGQAPFEGGATLRCVLPEGENCNLGPGPEPVMDRFHAAVLEQLNSG